MKVLDVAQASLAKLVSTMTTATTSVSSSLVELREKLKASELEREAILSSWVPLNEAMAILRAWVAAQVRRVSAEEAIAVGSRFAAPPKGVNATHDADAQPNAMFDRWSHGQPLHLDDLAGLFPDLVGPALERLLQDAYNRPGARVGLPGDQRAERYAAILQELEEIEQAEEALIVQARKQGLRLERRRNKQAVVLEQQKTLERKL